MLDGGLCVGGGQGSRARGPVAGMARDSTSQGRAGSRRVGPAAAESQGPSPWPCRQDAVLTAVREWEARNARALRERETQALQEREQEQLLTYTREDAYNAVCGAQHPVRFRGTKLFSRSDSRRVMLDPWLHISGHTWAFPRMWLNGVVGTLKTY